ncbi:uncharacterized protein LOC116348878 [Contarinia nasturtii]|uniref:uncharacterized protein LOC116348878 n=1 Tax=Contarinia nasturtii TaxID=265458 RepID=UPI0012D406B4|nr:uncharacterized protein LOC116348878 [Contarinia nasturtii]
MCGQMCYGYLVLTLIVLCDISFANKYCAKIDFNRPIYNEVRECRSQNHLPLASKSYATNKDFLRYRPNSMFYLANNFFNYSCVEISMELKIDSNTVIEAALYLKSINHAFVEFNVYEERTHELIKSIHTDGTTGWTILRGNYFRNIPNARVEIKAFMNEYSRLGIEFLHITNTAIKVPECTSDFTKPTKPPTMTTTLIPTSTTSTGPIEISSKNTWIWVIIGLGVAILFVVIILICVNCVCSSR